MDAELETPTLTDGAPRLATVRKFRVSVVEGPRRGLEWESTGDGCSVGSAPSNDLAIDDPTISRFHCELRVGEGGVRIRDLGSRNGTIVDNVVVFHALLRGESLVRLGGTLLRFQLGAGTVHLAASERERFGSLQGSSFAMRSVFSLLERAAASQATVLLEGETGTGKGQAAISIHRESSRRERPFVVVDCGAIPENLLESELFGHEKGSFTGAAERRIGAFEAASGGTIFLDEIGEMPVELQPKLLRVLEGREIRRVGSNVLLPVDVRVVAATNRDLRSEVNAGRFRSDLYYRLAVVRVLLPPLRQRPEDVAPLARRIIESLDDAPEAAAILDEEGFLARLEHHGWPGNVRELRNYLERCLVFRSALPMTDEPEARAPEQGVELGLPFVEARDRALARSERSYLEALMRAHGGKPSQAAAAAGIGRVYLYKLLRKHGLK